MLSTQVEEFENAVWRVLPFADKPLLAIELRDADRLQVWFAAVDVASGNLVLPPVKAPEPWWSGLQGAAHSQLYLHLFHPQPKVGVKGLAAISADSGEVTWQREDLAFRGTQNGHLLAQPANDPEADSLLLDPKTGTGEKPVGPLTEAAAGTAKTLFPVSYAVDNPHYATLEHFLELKLQQQIKGPIEYLETDRHIIFSIHLPAEQGLANYLVIFANNGHLRHRTRLAQDLTGFAADTFFLFADKVVCVQDRKRLLLIELQ